MWTARDSNPRTHESESRVTHQRWRREFLLTATDSHNF
jgi:hypothetical protein